jgi:hypothetical protein
MFKVIASLISIVAAKKDEFSPCVTYTTDKKTGKKISHNDWECLASSQTVKKRSE